MLFEIKLNLRSRFPSRTRQLAISGDEIEWEGYRFAVDADASGTRVPAGATIGRSGSALLEQAAEDLDDTSVIYICWD